MTLRSTCRLGANEIAQWLPRGAHAGDEYLPARRGRSMRRYVRQSQVEASPTWAAARGRGTAYATEWVPAAMQRVIRRTSRSFRVGSSLRTRGGVP